MHAHALTPHASTPCALVERLEASASRTADTLVLEFKLVGDIAGLRIPPRRTLSRADDLWRHTCFEAFVAPIGGERYCEINLSPSHQWAIYAFDRYRDGMKSPQDASAQTLIVGDGPGYLSLSARVALHDRELAAQDWQVSLCAVIEDAQGTMSYWALTHPREKADFHDRAGYVLPLPA